MSKEEHKEVDAPEEEGGEQQETQTEQRARAQGWMPQDEWVDQGGDPEQWKPADQFVKDGEEIAGITRERNRKLESEVADLKKSMQDMKQMLTKREQRGYDKALQDIQAKREKAVEDGDTEEFNKLEKQKGQLEKERNEIAQSAPEEGSDQEDPAFREWVNENSWYDESKNPEMAATAEGIANSLTRQKPTLTGKPFLDEVTRQVKKIYPEQFENPKREQPSKVEGSSQPSGKKNKNSYSDLPDEAKKACDRFIKQGVFQSRDEYVKEYFGMEE